LIEVEPGRLSACWIASELPEIKAAASKGRLKPSNE